jgi:hypothetical protein
MNFKHSSIVLITILFCLMFTSACKRRKPYAADISSIQIPPVEIKRYEKALFTIGPDNLEVEIKPYVQEFSLFLGDEIYTQQGQQQLYDYITDPFIRELFDDTMQQWESVSRLENELHLAFRYYQYHFPEMPIPVVYSYISGIDFEMPVKHYENNLIIGLDMFLGRDYLNYERIGIPAFKRQRFLPQSVAVESMRVLGETIMRHIKTPPENLLDFMIYEGKLLYFLDCMLPDYPDSLKISFTQQQIAWAERNQGQAWSFYIQNELLYSPDRQMIQKFIGPAPFTAPFSGGSAPRMGAYNGWQIVREYMRRNPDVPLKELMVSLHAREILSKANYRP